MNRRDLFQIAGVALAGVLAGGVAAGGAARIDEMGPPSMVDVAELRDRFRAHLEGENTERNAAIRVVLDAVIRAEERGYLTELALAILGTEWESSDGSS
jgi:hypothetical protein